MRYGQRLKLARGKVTQQALQELSGVSQSLISPLETSETATGSEYTARLARALRVSVDWLADELGEMIPRYETVSDPVELAALRLLRAMPAAYRAQAVKQLDSLAEFSNQITDGRANG